MGNEKHENGSEILKNIKSQEEIIYNIVEKLNTGYYNGSREVSSEVLDSLVALTTFIATSMMDIGWHMYRSMYPETKYEHVLNNRMLVKTVHEIYYKGKIYSLMNNATKATKQKLDLTHIKTNLCEVEGRNKDEIKKIRHAVGGHIDKNPKVLYEYSFVGASVKIKPIAIDTYELLTNIIGAIRLYGDQLYE